MNEVTIEMAIEEYKKGQASPGKTAELAGISFGEMMTTLEDSATRTQVT